MRLRQWMVLCCVSTEDDRADHLDDLTAAVEQVMGGEYFGVLPYFADARTGYLLHATRRAMETVVAAPAGLGLIREDVSLVNDQLVHPDRDWTVELYKQLQHRRFPNRETWQRALDTYVPICTGDRIRYLAYRHLYEDDRICGGRTHAATRQACTPAATR